MVMPCCAQVWHRLRPNMPKFTPGSPHPCLLIPLRSLPPRCRSLFCAAFAAECAGKGRQTERGRRGRKRFVSKADCPGQVARSSSIQIPLFVHLDSNVVISFVQVVLCPLLPSASGRILCMNVVLCGSLVMVAYGKPWRHRLCNALEPCSKRCS